MNIQIANKLNQLLRASSLFTISEYSVEITTDLSNFDASVATELAEKCREIMASNSEQALDEEIKSAAKERRAACTNRYPACDRKLYHGNFTSLSVREFNISRPQIEVLIESDNARRLAEYETYRTVCEQGVAVPPQA